MHSHIKHYRILRELGGGGFAQVYLAFDEQLHREVAIKVLHANLADDQGYRRFFEREARIVASLEQLAVVPIYDFGEIGGDLYLVMRYMRGGTLADRLFERKKALPLGEVIALLERLASTFDAMHQRGIIHRDLKPANILYDEAGSPHIADFGIARMQQATSQFTQTGMSFGTPQYSSPEQITGEGILDHRTDIYSLGVILYQLLTTEYPFRADTPLGWVYQHTEAPIPDIRKVNRHLPEGISRVIEKLLAKRPDDRYESVAAVLADLKRVDHGLPVTVVNPSLLDPVPPQEVPSPKVSSYPKPIQAEAPSRPPMNLVTLGLMGTAIAMVAIVGVVMFVLWQNQITGGTAETPPATIQPTEPVVIVRQSPTSTTAPDTTQTPVIGGAPPPDATATAQQISNIATAQAMAVYEQLPEEVRAREAFLVPFATSAPQLDGNLSEWVFPYFSDVSHILFGAENAQTPQDLSGACAGQWNDDFLYIACVVRDDQLVQLSSGNLLYEGDSLELHFDTRLMQDIERAEMDQDDYQIGVFPGDVVGRASEAYRWFPLNKEGALPNVRIAGLRTNDGYTFEAEVPWNDIEMKPKSGEVYGFGLVINDTDTPDTTAQESQATLFESHQWATPPSWGLLVLLPAP